MTIVVLRLTNENLSSNSHLVTTKAPRLEWVKPALQARSQQTLERLLDAAEARVIEVGVERATVSDIARAAGSSVGAFYARFSDKEALLRCLFERFSDQALATVDVVLEPTRWEGIATDDALEDLVRFMLRIFRERRLLIAAFSLRAAGEPELATLGERLGQHITDRLLALLEARGEVPARSDPRGVVEIAVWLVLSALEARALYSPRGVRRHSEPFIARELVRMCARYLGLRETQRDDLPSTEPDAIDTPGSAALAAAAAPRERAAAARRAPRIETTGS